MNKNKKRLVIANILLILMLIVFLIGGYTYSKYINQVKGSGLIEVARWDFTVNGATTLMQKINLAQTYTAETVAENRIAPGIKGSFDIVINANRSETGIKYNVKFANEMNRPRNLLYSYEDYEVADIHELEQYLTGVIHYNDDEKERVLTINWRWPYETGVDATEVSRHDIEDTRDGRNLYEYSFDIIVTGEQEEPERVTE